MWFSINEVSERAWATETKALRRITCLPDQTLLVVGKTSLYGRQTRFDKAVEIVSYM